jgi:hypothetical protein
MENAFKFILTSLKQIQIYAKKREREEMNTKKVRGLF